MQYPEIPCTAGQLRYFRGPYVLTTGWALCLPLLDSEQNCWALKHSYTHIESAIHTLCIATTWRRASRSKCLHSLAICSTTLLWIYERSKNEFVYYCTLKVTVNSVPSDSELSAQWQWTQCPMVRKRQWAQCPVAGKRQWTQCPVGPSLLYGMERTASEGRVPSDVQWNLWFTFIFSYVFIYLLSLFLSILCITLFIHSQ